MSAPHPLVPYEERRSYSTKNIPCDKLYCECGHNNQAKILGIHNNWALWLICSSQSCMRTWYICNQCNNSRSKITSKPAMVRHYRDLHFKKKKVTNDYLKKRARIDDDSSEGLIMSEDNAYCPPNESDETSFTGNEMMDEENGVPSERNEENHQSRFDVDSPIHWVDVRNPKKIGFDNNASQAYFGNCYRFGEGEWGGVQYLVRKSVAQDDYQDAEMDKIDIPLDHCDLHMKIARLSFLLSKKEWSHLTDVINSVWQVGCEDGYKAATLDINSDMNKLYINDDLDIIPDFVRHRLARPYNSDLVKRSPEKRGIIIPGTSNDIRKYYMEGRFSVLQNMPCPKVFGDAIPGHSYVSIIDCIRDFLAHTGTGRIAAIASDSTINFPVTGVVEDTVKSRHVVEIVRREQNKDYVRTAKPLMCMVFFWSDDFEPNGVSKGMRGSAWIKTMTLLTRKENGQSSTHTYPISFGLKNDSHDEVEAAINNEMKVIQNGSVGPFYDGIARKLVHLFFDVHATLQDQPERRGANGLGAGPSNFHARWGVSGNHTELFKVLKCCNACLKVLQDRYSEKQFVLPIPDCNECLCWDILSESILSKNTMPKNYPPPHTIGCDNNRLVEYNKQFYVRPFRITYQSLKAAIVEAHTNYLTKEWSPLHCTAFLKVEGLNDKMIENFLDHAVNEASLTSVLKDEERLQLELQKEMNPRLFERVPFLALWDRDNVELTSHPDVIMHLLFLGVVKSTVNTVKKWLTCIGKNTTFLNSNEALLASFKRFSLDWLRILPFKGPKLGGWVSENYLGFSRIILWFYQNIEGAAAIIDNAPPDQIEQRSWLLKHNKFWLRSRGLDCDGLAPELSKRVAEYLAKDPVPELLDQPTRKIEDVELTLVALTQMLRCIMADIVSDESIMETDYCVRIFLSHFSSLSATTWTPGEKKKEAKVKVISSFNFICLMNLPDAMKRYGPLRHLWEGSFRGEGFLRQTKLQMMQGFKSNWQINIHRNILHEKAFQNIFQGCDGKTNLCGNQSILSENARNIHSYDSTYEVRDVLLEVTMQKKRPLSVFAVRSERCPARLFAKIKYSDCVTQIRLVKDNNTNQNDHIMKFGLAYFEFELQNVQDYTEWATDIEPELGPDIDIVFGVLLPLLEEDNCINSRKFALVSSTWKNLEPHTTLDSIF